MTSRTPLAAFTFTFTFALLLICSAAAAGPREDAARRFAETHPDARFVEDGAAHRYYLVHGFELAPTGSLVESARDALLAQGALLGLDGEGTELVFDRVVSHNGSRYVKFAQRIRGLPVFGVKIVAHVDPRGASIKMSSKAPRPPAPDAGRAPIDAEDAAAAAEDFDATGTAVAVHEGWLPIQDQAIRVFRVLTAAPGPHRWVTFVDAHGGNVIYRYDEIKRHAANVYLENPTASGDLTEVLLENIVPEGEHVNRTYGDFLRAARCTSLSYQTGACTAWAHQAVAAPPDGFLGVAPDDGPGKLTDGFAEVQAYFSLDTYYAFWREEFGFDPQFVDAGSSTPGPSIWVFVNANFENAYFSGSSSYYGNPDMIVMGQGSKDFAYDNDVSRHEFTHAVSSQSFDIWMYNVDDLGTDMSGGGVEEGTADFFPCSFHGNPLLGEYMGVIRSAQNARKCPDHLIGQSHEDGMIISGTMWSIRQHIGERKANHLHYGALASNTIITFNDYADALEVQAYLMQDHEDPELQLTDEDLQFVSDTLDFRNLRNCRRVVPVEPGDQLMQVTLYSFSSLGTPSPVQYMVSSKADTEQLSLTINPFGDPYDVYVRKDLPVRFSWTQGGYSLDWTAEYDMAFVYSGEKITKATISNATDLVLEQNSDYYFSLICRISSNGYGCQNVIGAALSTTPAEEPDTDTGSDADTDQDGGPSAEDDGGSGGCGCRAGGAPGSPGLAALLRSLIAD
jgi:hypothetical protein